MEKLLNNKSWPWFTKTRKLILNLWPSCAGLCSKTWQRWIHELSHIAHTWIVELKYLLCARMSWQDDAAAPRSTRVRTVPDGENGTGVMERDDGETKEDEVRRGEDPSDPQASQGPSQRSKITVAESKTSTSKVKKQRRTRCAYGSSCYRYFNNLLITLRYQDSVQTSVYNAINI